MNICLSTLLKKVFKQIAYPKVKIDAFIDF